MKFINSNLSNQVLESHTVKSGKLYFLKNIVVAEFNEGVHIDFNSSQEYIGLILDFYGDERPFGYICNRINDFSISPLDYPKFNRALNNLSIYGIVFNNRFDRINFNIEKRFCDKPYKGYNDLYTAFNQVSIFVNNTKKELIETPFFINPTNI